MKQIFKILGWSRDAKGKVIKRPQNDYCNAITTTVDHSIGYDSIGMGNTTPYVFIRYEDKDAEVDKD